MLPNEVCLIVRVQFSGAAVAATDSDNDTLNYSLASTGDGSSFTIDLDSGQLLTSDALLYETKSSCTVTVNVRDSKDAVGNANTVTDDSITVTITVTNEDEDGTASISGTLSGGTTLTASVTDIDGIPTSVDVAVVAGEHCRRVIHEY